MNMHPGDLRSVEEQGGADSAQKEETSLIDPPHVSEMTKTLIHIEAGGSFLVGILICRFRRILFVFAFGAVYDNDNDNDFYSCNRIFCIRGFIVRVQVNWFGKFGNYLFGLTHRQGHQIAQKRQGLPGVGMEWDVIKF